MLKVLTDDTHAGDKSFVEYFLNRPSLSEGVYGHLLDFFGLALIQALIHPGIVNHLPLPRT
jgi:hypothetical protein